MKVISNYSHNKTKDVIRSKLCGIQIIHQKYYKWKKSTFFFYAFLRTDHWRHEDRSAILRTSDRDCIKLDPVGTFIYNSDNQITNK